MYKINFHAHSYFSDGHNSIAEMALRCKQLGFSCCVITDHVYTKDPERGDSLSLNIRKYEMQIAEAAAISELSNYPIIVGGEVGVVGLEEVVVIGEDAIKHLLEVREERRIEIRDMQYIRSNFKCACFLCHPVEPENFIIHKGLSIIDGYELCNSGHSMFSRRDNPLKDYKLVELCNSDAHHTDCLIIGYNEIEQNLISESDIIKWLRGKNRVTRMQLRGSAL